MPNKPIKFARRTRGLEPRWWNGPLVQTSFAMRTIQALLIFLVSISCLAGPETIPKDALVGKWVSYYGFNVTEPKKATINTLEITQEFGFTFKRAFDNGKIQLFAATASDFEMIEDIFIFSLSANDSLSYKLVLSGWVNGETKLIFGTLYLYEKGQLFNDVPVSFKPASS